MRLNLSWEKFKFGWNVWNARISVWNALISLHFTWNAVKYAYFTWNASEMYKNRWFPLKSVSILGIGDCRLSSKTNKMRAFQLEIHERPLPGVEILFNFVHILAFYKSQKARQITSILGIYCVSLIRNEYQVLQYIYSQSVYHFGQSAPLHLSYH